MNTTHTFIQCYTHDGRIGVLVELGFELSVTACEPDFLAISKDIAMHIAALAPRDIGSLLSQPFVKAEQLSVAEHLAEVSARVEDHLRIKRYVRWASEPNDPQQDQPEPPAAPAASLRA